MGEKICAEWNLLQLENCPKWLSAKVIVVTYNLYHVHKLKARLHGINYILLCRQCNFIQINQ